MIKAIKLISGELVIAEVEDVAPNKLKLINPNAVVFSNQGLMLVPLIPPNGNKDVEIIIDRSYIMFVVDGVNIDQNLYTGYSQRYGSGITIANDLPSEVKLVKNH